MFGIGICSVLCTVYGLGVMALALAAKVVLVIRLLAGTRPVSLNCRVAELSLDLTFDGSPLPPNAACVLVPDTPSSSPESHPHCRCGVL